MATSLEDRQRNAPSLGIKAPCVVAAASPITLSGLQTIDGVTLAEGDRVLVNAQSSAVSNGIYTASALAWSRSMDFDGVGDAVQGTLVNVNRGTGAGLYKVTTTAAIGTDSVTFTSYGISGEGTVTPESFGAVGDGATDDHAALQAAIDSGKRIIGTPDAQYLTKSALYIKNATFYFDLNTATLVDEVNGNCLYVEQEFTQLQTIAAMSTVAYDLDNSSSNTCDVTRLTVTDASVYPVGSRIKIMSKDLLSGPEPADSERQGEYATVSAIDAVNNYVYTTAPLAEAYTTYATDPRVALMPDNGHSFTFINGKYRTSDVKHASTTWPNAAIRVSGFGYGNVRCDITCERARAVFFLAESCVGFKDGDINILAMNCDTDTANGRYGYGLFFNACQDCAGKVYGINVRHAFTTGSGAAHATDYTQEAIKQCGRTRRCTVAVDAIACTASAADLHPDAIHCTLNIFGVSGSYRGNGGADGCVSLRGIENTVNFLGVVTGGRAVNVNADYDHVDNSRGHVINNAVVIVGPNGNDAARYPFSVIGRLGSSGDNCRGIVFNNPTVIRRGDNFDLPDFFVQDGEMILNNPTIVWESGFTISYLNSTPFRTANAGRLIVNGGRLDIRQAAGAGIRLVHNKHDGGNVLIDGLRIECGAADKVAALADQNSANGTVDVRNVVMDYQPSVAALVVNTAAGVERVGYRLNTAPSPQPPKMLEGSLTYDLASVANNGFATFDITVYGARVGDFVSVTCSASTGGLMITPYVSAANTVSLGINNFSGSAIDIASAVWAARVTPIEMGFGGYDLDYTLLTGTAAYDPPSLATNTSTTTTVTVTGARVGEYVQSVWMDVDTLKVYMRGVVTADNTVTVTLWNRHSATHNIAAGNIFVTVLARTHIWAWFTWDPASLTTGSGDELATAAFTGARLGDVIEYLSFSKPLQGMQLKGNVTASDSALFRAENETGSTVNLNSGILRAGLRRKFP